MTDDEKRKILPTVYADQPAPIITLQKHKELSSPNEYRKFWFDILMSEAPYFILSVLAALGSSLITVQLPGLIGILYKTRN